jgi:hypothetical protein
VTYTIKGSTRTEYRTIDTTTLKGLKEAERLHASGWTQVRVGLFSTQFMRKTIKTV